MSVRFRLCRCGAHHPMGVACPLQPSRAKYGRRYWQARNELVASSIVCHICGLPPTADDPLTADHVVPVVHGGVAGPLAAAHRSCNLRAGQKLAQ